MKEKTINKEMKKIKEDKISCADQFCPTHGRNAVKTRGRIFEGTVIKKLPKRVKIVFERTLYVPKYERFEKRKTKIHARLPDCMDDIVEGDYIEVQECRPLSKLIHFYVIRKIRSKSDGENKQ
jgi:small subunit ribosomal protein S17